MDDYILSTEERKRIRKLLRQQAEKVPGQKAATYVQSRIARGSKVDIATLLAKVPDTAPEAYDVV